MAEDLSILTPPQNLEAEQCTLGSMMIDRSALEKGLGVLSVHDFYLESHQKVFEALTSLAERSEPVDIVSLQEELRSKQQLDAVGGTEYLMQLLDTVPTSAHLEYYARIVEDKSQRRGLIKRAHELAQAAADAGCPKERLSELAAGLLEAPASRSLVTLTHAELASGELPSIEWVCENLIPAGGITVIGGDSGVGKSWVAVHLAQCVAAGLPFLGEFAVTPGKVLVVDAESSLNLLERRLKKLFAGLKAQHPDVSEGLPLTFIPAALRLSGKGLCQLAALIVQEGAALIVVDPLIHACDGEENSAESMAAFFEGIREIQRQTGSTFVFCHHSRKESRLASNAAGQMLRGSSAIRGILDSHIFLRKLKGDKLLCEHDKSRYAELLPPFVIAIADQDEQSTTVRYIGEAEGEADKTEFALTVILRTVADAGGAAPRKTLVEQGRTEGIPERTINRVLTLACERKELTKERRGMEVWYKLPETGLFDGENS